MLTSRVLITTQGLQIKAGIVIGIENASGIILVEDYHRESQDPIEAASLVTESFRRVIAADRLEVTVSPEGVNLENDQLDVEVGRESPSEEGVDREIVRQGLLGIIDHRGVEN